MTFQNYCQIITSLLCHCWHLLFLIQAEIFIVLTISCSSNWKLHTFGIMIWNSGSYLNHLLYCLPLWQGKRTMPCYCQKYQFPTKPPLTPYGRRGLLITARQVWDFYLCSLYWHHLGNVVCVAYLPLGSGVSLNSLLGPMWQHYRWELRSISLLLHGL